jgi:hypothetical protein
MKWEPVLVDRFMTQSHCAQRSGQRLAALNVQVLTGLANSIPHKSSREVQRVGKPRLLA